MSAGRTQITRADEIKGPKHLTTFVLQIPPFPLGLVLNFIGYYWIGMAFLTCLIRVTTVTYIPLLYTVTYATYWVSTKLLAKRFTFVVCVEQPFETPISCAEIPSSDARPGAPGHMYSVCKMYRLFPDRDWDAILESSEALSADTLQ